MDDADSIDLDCTIYFMGGISVECVWRYRVISESISGMCIFVWRDWKLSFKCHKDKGFYLLMALEKSIFGDSCRLFFILLAAFQMLIIMWMFRKYSEDYWFSIFLFVASTDYISWTFNGIRQFTAVVIAYAATPFILKKKYIPSILLILLASTMHQSVLLMIPIIFIIQGKAWNKKTVVCILACLTALLFVDQFTNIMDSMLAETQYQNVVSDYKSWNDDGTNPLRVLVYSIPMILSLIGLKYVQTENDPMINTAVGASAIVCRYT